MKRLLKSKSISIVVMIAFFSMICFAYPGHSDQVVKTEKQEKVKATAAEAESEGAAEINEYYSRDDANVIEDEGYPGGKKKKFPWLLVIGGVVVVGVVLYFTVFKTKKYELTVTVGAGVNGTPTSGTYKHKKGTSVSYNYTLQSGYEQLVVKLDGTEVGASGTINMDAAHSLEATAVRSVTGTYKGTTNQGYAITLKVTKVGGVSTLTYFQIRMRSNVNSYGYYVTLTVTGYPSRTVTNYMFTYDGTYVDLSGTFTPNGTITASGDWTLHYNSYIYGNFTGSGTWNASKTARAARTTKARPGEVRISAEVFKDGKLIKRVDR